MRPTKLPPVTECGQVTHFCRIRRVPEVFFGCLFRRDSAKMPFFWGVFLFVLRAHFSKMARFQGVVLLQLFPRSSFWGGFFNTHGRIRPIQLAPKLAPWVGCYSMGRITRPGKLLNSLLNSHRRNILGGPWGRRSKFCSKMARKKQSITLLHFAQRRSFS